MEAPMVESMVESATADGILCSTAYDYGCGAQNASSAEKCKQCGRDLISIANKDFLVFTLGQSVCFARKGTGLFEKGSVVDISGSTVTVKYADPSWQDNRYDEECHVDSLFLTMEEATRSVQRSRRQVAPYELPVQQSVSKKRNTSELKVKKTEETGNVKTVIESPGGGHKKRLSASDPSVLSSSEAGVAPTKPASKKLCTLVPRKKAAGAAGFTDLEGVSGGVEAFQREQLVDRVFQEQNVNDLLTAFELRARATGGLRFDRWLHRGVLCHLMHWARPPRSDADNEYLGKDNQYRKPALSVAAFFDLVTACPLTVAELRAIPSCAFLLSVVSPIVPEPNFVTQSSSHTTAPSDTPGVTPEPTLTDSDAVLVDVAGVKRAADLYFSRHALSTHPSGAPTGPAGFGSVGEEIVHSLNRFLSARGRHPSELPLISVLAVGGEPPPITSTACERFRRKCMDVDQAGIEPIFAQIRRDLRPLGLRLPLSFAHFQTLMEATYDMMGGRDIIESGTSEIKGSKDVDGIKTMYGGVKEELVDDIVARTRLTRDSRFLDIGSGIGQTCIQVAATVGCSVAGVEIDHSRCKASRNLLIAFNCLLIEAGVEGGLVQVKFEEGNFVSRQDLVSWATVIYFNNFGPWFMEPIKMPEMENGGSSGKRGVVKISPMHRFCDQLKECEMGTQIVVLNPLSDGSSWLHMHAFGSVPGSASWTDVPLDMFLYTVVSKEWKCKSCSMMNLLSEADCVVCGTHRKESRQTGGSFTCR